MISSGSRGDVVFMDQVNRSTRGFTGSSAVEPLLFDEVFGWPSLGRLLNLVVSLCRKVLPVCGESPTLPPAPEYAVLFLDLVWPEWKVDRDGTFLGNATGCLEELTAGVRLLRFTMVESVVEFVFSVDEVFSYSVVDRRGISPALGPTVRDPLLGSNLLLVVLVVRGFAGLEIDELSAEVIGLVMLDAGLWFCAASLAVFSLMVAESIVFCRLKLLLTDARSEVPLLVPELLWLLLLALVLLEVPPLPPTPPPLPVPVVPLPATPPAPLDAVPVVAVPPVPPTTPPAPPAPPPAAAAAAAATAAAGPTRKVSPPLDARRLGFVLDADILRWTPRCVGLCTWEFPAVAPSLPAILRSDSDDPDRDPSDSGSVLFLPRSR